MNDFKMKSLDSIIDWADQKMMGNLKKKGAKVPEAPKEEPKGQMEIEIKAEPEMDDQTMKDLMKAYSEDECSDEPTNVNAKY